MSIAHGFPSLPGLAQRSAAWLRPDTLKRLIPRPASPMAVAVPKKVTLAWVRETSPGGTNPVPPPSRPTWEIEWWGERNGPGPLTRRAEETGHRMEPGDLEGFLTGHSREDAGGPTP